MHNKSCSGCVKQTFATQTKHRWQKSVANKQYRAQINQVLQIKKHMFKDRIEDAETVIN